MQIFVKSCIAVLLLPYATASSACSNGNCQVDDEMHLMQLKHTLKAGLGRSAQDADFSADFSAEDLRPFSNELAQESDASAQQLDKMVQDLLNEQAVDSELEIDSVDEEMGALEKNEVLAPPRRQIPNPPNKATPPSNGAPDMASHGSAVEEHAGEEDQSEAHAPLIPLPADCTSYGPCLGEAREGGHCDGNQWDCQKIGFNVVGYVAGCPGDTKVCTSGYKVQCGVCSLTAVYPTPSPFPAPWVTPAPAPATPAPATPAPFPPMVLPTDKPIFAPFTYTAGSVGNATLALKKAHELLKAMRLQLNNVTKQEEHIKKNISMYTNIEKEAKEAHLRDRKAAVEFAKKKQLANITLAKVQKKLGDAYFAQKNAENGAVIHWEKAQSANRQTRYYKKHCITLKYEKEQTYENYTIAGAAAHRAHAELQEAKKERRKHESRSNKKNVFKRHVAHSGTKYSERMSVKQAMEEAFAAGSRSRNASLNVPVGGGKWWHW
jgi:hypothetical protein